MDIRDDELRRAVTEAQRRHENALRENAEARHIGGPRPHPAVSLLALRSAIDSAAREARKRGCDISDLVGGNVGRRDP